jgi:hypothetical protein
MASTHTKKSSKSRSTIAEHLQNIFASGEQDDMGHLVNALLDLAERMANRHQHLFV